MKFNIGGIQEAIFDLTIACIAGGSTFQFLDFSFYFLILDDDDGTLLCAFCNRF